LVEHAKVALEHSLAGAIEAKGVPKTHLDAASASLQEAIDHGTLGHADLATKSAEEAVEHLKKPAKITSIHLREKGGIRLLKQNHLRGSNHPYR
jgi:hypothetical protein